MIKKSEMNRLKAHYNAKIKYDMILEASADDHNKKYFVDELKQTKFCSTRFTKYLHDDCDKYMYVGCDTVKLHVFFGRKHMVPLTKIIKSLKQVYACQKFFAIDKVFNIYINMCPYERYIDERPMSPDHINGGFTDTNSNSIFIIRSQEFSKVILHEVLHHSKQIHNNNWNMSEINILKSVFNIGKSTLLLPNEAVVELWASYMHCLFMSFDYGMPLQNILNAEIENSFIQSNRIIRKQKQELNAEWNETTNAYCYIIFKTIMLADMNQLHTHKMHDTKYITEFIIDHRKNIKMLDGNNCRFCLMKTSDY